MQGLSGVAISSMVAMAADAKDRSAVVAKDVAILAQAHIDLQAENVRLREALRELWRTQDPDAWDETFAHDVSELCKQ